MYYYYYYCHSFLSELDISLLQGHLVRAGGGGGGEDREVQDYQQLVWEMNLSCLRYFLSSQGGVNLDYRKQQKMSLSPLLLPTSLHSPENTR